MQLHINLAVMHVATKSNGAAQKDHNYMIVMHIVMYRLEVKLRDQYDF